MRGMRGFLCWAFALLALPGCAQLAGIEPWEGSDSPAPDPGFNLVRGSLPRDGVVFCDVPKVIRCATPQDELNGIRLSEAALALNTGHSNTIGLDDSEAATSQCSGKPLAIEYHGNFPEGKSVCLNCGEVLGAGKTYPDTPAVCQALCYDLVPTSSDSEGTATPVKPPTQATIEYCAAKAHVSTNMPLDACFPNACENAGTLKSPYDDPRRSPDAVVWADLIGTSTGGTAGNDLVRDTPTSGQFDAGAVANSTQWVKQGDAFVEFSVTGGTSQILGWTEIPGNCGAPCTDNDPSQDGIGFGILVQDDGSYFVLENGATRTGPNIGGSWGPSTPGDRFRVYLHDKGNETAEVRYSKLVGTCDPGVACNETIFYTAMGVAQYPLRVDASLFHGAARLIDVRLMRIK